MFIRNVMILLDVFDFYNSYLYFFLIFEAQKCIYFSFSGKLKKMFSQWCLILDSWICFHCLRLSFKKLSELRNKENLCSIIWSVSMSKISIVFLGWNACDDTSVEWIKAINSRLNWFQFFLCNLDCVAVDGRSTV